MASKGKIDEVVDVPAVKKQIDFLKAELDEIIKKFSVYASAFADMSSKAKSSKSMEETSRLLKEQAVLTEKVSAESKKQVDVTAKLAQETARLNSLNNGGAAAELELLKIKQQRVARERELLQQAKDAINSNSKQKQTTEELINAAKRQVNTIRAIEEETKKLNQIKKDIILVEGKQSKQVAEINSMIDKNTRILRENGDAATKQRMNIGNYASAVGGLQKAIAGIATAWASLTFFKDAFKAYEQQEQANRKLLFSLKGNAIAFKQLTDQANDFQSKTGIADDAIQGIQVLAAESGKGTIEIKKITEATINWSKLTGQDLQSAYLQINATLNGTAGRLTRVDAQFGTLTETQLKNGAAIDLINTKYKDFAQNAASDTEVLAANWDEFKELVGKSVSGVIIPALSTLNTALSVVTSDSLSWIEKLNVMRTGTYAMAKAAIEHKKSQQEANAVSAEAAIRSSKTTEEIIKQAQATGKAKAQALDYSAAFNAYAEANKKTIEPIKKQITEYQKLQDNISALQSKMMELRLANQPIPDSMIHELISSKGRLEEVKNEVEAIAQSMVSIQGKSAAIIPISNTPGNILTPRSGIGSGGAENNLGAADTFFSNDQVIEMAQQTADATFEIITNASNAEHDYKISLLEAEKDKELSNKKLTAEQKAAIEERYAKKIGKIKEDQFKKDKTAAIIQQIINTSLAVMKNGGPLTPMGAATALAGLLQIAVIKAQPIPKYFKGRQGGPAELAYVHPGEAVEIGNKLYPTPNRETLTFLPKGASVIPNKDLIAMSQSLSFEKIPKSYAGINTAELRRLQKEVFNLNSGFEMLAAVIKNKKEFHLNITEKGVWASSQRGASVVEYINQNIRF